MATATLPENRQTTLTRPDQERLFSLDLFRGLTIAAMIVVNNQSSVSAYWPLRHAEWNGCTPTDLIFPFFLFIVGVSLVFSTNARLDRGDSRWTLILHAFRRSAMLFVIGLVLNGLAGLPLSTWRIPGVLQRIAIAYCAATLITLFTKTPARLAWIAGLLLGYWALLRFVPVPGYGLPVRDIPLLHPDGNLVAYFDRRVMAGHLWEGTRDPEGILSTLPAIATTLFGVLAGEWLRSDRPAIKKLQVMLVWGVVGIIAGLLWSIWFPLNKKLWTSSYAAFTAGCAAVALAACYWATDIKRHRGAWTRPFVIFGTNAIAAYVISELIGGWLGWKGYTFLHGLAWLDSPALISLLHSLLVLMLCFIPIWLLYRRRIFLKV
jgi:predicted acyltransferase